MWISKREKTKLQYQFLNIILQKKLYARYISFSRTDMNPRATKVKATVNYLIELEFGNGEHGLFSMLSYLNYPVFQPLKDISLFTKAHVTMGFVSWNENIDMSPDTLYLESKISV